MSRYASDRTNTISLWNVLLHGLDWIFGMFREWTVARVVNLTQVSLPRLGEVNRDSPRLFHANGRSGDQLSFEQASVSLRRWECRLSENVQRPLSLDVKLSPERETLSLERGPLAWAKSWARVRSDLMFPFLCLACKWMDCCIMAWWGMNMHEQEGAWVMNDELG